jgi:hypothetical protein
MNDADSSALNFYVFTDIADELADKIKKSLFVVI